MNKSCLGIEPFLFVVLCRIVLGVTHKSPQMLDRFVHGVEGIRSLPHRNWLFFLANKKQCDFVMSKRNPHIFSNGQGSPCCLLCISNLYLGVSKNRSTPKWMVYNGNLIKMDDLGVPLFSETSIWGCLVSSRKSLGLPLLQRSFVVSSKNNILKSGGRTGNSGKFW